MTDAERRRLARILGMLGSEHEGERQNAARQAEAFRKQHGLSWEDLIQGRIVYLGGDPPWRKPAPAAPQARPEPPQAPRKRSPFSGPTPPPFHPFVPPADAMIGIDGGKVRALLYVIVMIGGAILINII